VCVFGWFVFGGAGLFEIEADSIKAPDSMAGLDLGGFIPSQPDSIESKSLRKHFVINCYAIVGVDRRPIDVILGRESGLAQGSMAVMTVTFSVFSFEPRAAQKSVDSEPRPGRVESEKSVSDRK